MILQIFKVIMVVAHIYNYKSYINIEGKIKIYIQIYILYFIFYLKISFLFLLFEKILEVKFRKDGR